jgi:hypothetical protein
MQAFYGGAATVGLLGSVVDFACIRSQNGAQCPLAIARAIRDSGLDEILEGNAIFELHDIYKACVHSSCPPHMPPWRGRGAQRNTAVASWPGHWSTRYAVGERFQEPKTAQPAFCQLEVLQDAFFRFQRSGVWAS